MITASEQTAQLVQWVCTGQLDEIERHCAARLRVAARDAEAWHFLGVAAYQRAQYSEAVERLRRAVELCPDDANALNNLALSFQALGRNDEAIEPLLQAIRLQPGAPVYLSNLANVLNLLEQYPAAEELARAALRIEPALVDAHVGLGAALSFQGDALSALGCFERAVALSPPHIEARRNLAHALVELGRFDEAREAYQRCLDVDELDGDAWYGLATTRRFTSADESVFQRLRLLVSDPRATVGQRADLHATLGKMLDDCGRYDEAFEHFSRAKLPPRDPFRAEELTRRVDAWIAAFPRSRFERSESFGSASELPVFIVGMPRCGSTLVEQIVAAHGEVHAGGELSDLNAIMTGRFEPIAEVDPQTLAEIEPAQIRRWSQWYLARRLARAGGATRMTDKMPFNFMFLGLAALMFPRARVVHCRRDPLDCGLSIYAQRFTLRPDFASSLRDIGLFHRQYTRLMNHWRETLPLRMLEIDYEELSAQPEATTRRLIDFCGLPWDQRCLRADEVSRAVQTASSWQVRQPVHGRSIGRWRRYQRHLQELVEALELG